MTKSSKCLRIWGRPKIQREVLILAQLSMYPNSEILNSQILLLMKEIQGRSLNRKVILVHYYFKTKHRQNQPISELLWLLFVFLKMLHLMSMPTINLYYNSRISREITCKQALTLYSSTLRLQGHKLYLTLTTKPKLNHLINHMCNI